MHEKKILFYVLFYFACSFYAGEVTFSFAKDFEGWGQWQAEGAVVKFFHDAETGHSEAGSLSIILGPEAPLDKSVCFTKRLSVKVGGNYTALVYVKVENLEKTATISLAFQGQDAKNKFLGTEVRSSRLSAEQCPEGVWVRMVYSIIVDGNDKWRQAEKLLCTIGVSKSSRGQLWFDDFYFFENK